MSCFVSLSASTGNVIVPEAAVAVAPAALTLPKSSWIKLPLLQGPLASQFFSATAAPVDSVQHFFHASINGMAVSVRETDRDVSEEQRVVVPERPHLPAQAAEAEACNLDIGCISLWASDAAIATDLAPAPAPEQPPLSLCTKKRPLTESSVGLAMMAAAKKPKTYTPTTDFEKGTRCYIHAFTLAIDMFLCSFVL